MNREPNFFQNLQDKLSDGRAWLDRSMVLIYAVLAGLLVVSIADPLSERRSPAARHQSLAAADFIGHASTSHTAMSTALKRKMPWLPQALSTSPPTTPPAKIPSDIMVL